MRVCGRRRMYAHSRMNRGFTIVELLIVIVVIAILTVVAIVSYAGIQSRAHDAAIRSDFRAVHQLFDLYNQENGTYPHYSVGDAAGCGSSATGSAALRPLLQSIPMKLSTGSYNTSTANTNLLYLASNDGQKWALLGYAIGNPTYVVTHEGVVRVYEPDPAVSQTRYPGGTRCGVADRLGISSPAVNDDFTGYYIFIREDGGFRIWK